MRPPQEYTLDALRQLVGVSEIYQRAMFDRQLMGMNTHHFISEFCLIKLMGPRGCGHTTALIQLAKERFRNWVIIITPEHSAHKAHVEAKIRQVWGIRHRILVIRGWTARDTIQRPHWEPESVDAIMIDMASHWNHTQLERIRMDTYHTAEYHIQKKEPFFYIEVQ